MKNLKSVILVIIWLFTFFLVLWHYARELYYDESLPKNIKLAFQCMLAGGAGGGLYLLRSVYLNYCLRDNWQPRWILWYFLRPFASIVCGGIAMIFLKAGLLVLNADSQTEITSYGFIAFAFIGGLNVDNFIKKLEELAEVAWGISKTRAGGGAEAADGSDPGAKAVPSALTDHFDTLPIDEQFRIAERWVEANAAAYKVKYPEITGVFAARKNIGNKVLETVSVTFQVTNKGGAAADFPATVLQDGFTIPTDVQQAGYATPNTSIDSGISRQQENEFGTMGIPVRKDKELYFMSCYHVYCNIELKNNQLEVISGIHDELVSPCYNDIKGPPPSPANIVGKVVEGRLTDFLDVAIMKPQVPIGTAYDGIPGPIYYRTPAREQENKIYLRFRGHGSKRFCEGMLRNVYTNQYIDYKGKPQHYLRGLIAMDRCATGGDSGAAVCDLAGNYIGYVVASDDLYTYILSASTISDKTNYKFT